MWTFLTVLRWIVAIPALLVGLLLQFLAIMLNLATGIIEILAGKAASLLATGTTLLLLLMLIIGEKGFIAEKWYLWLIMYGCAGIIFILPLCIDYVILGVSLAGDWLVQIPPWKGV